MSRKKLADMTEAELNAHYRKKKIKEDSRALRKYADRLHREVKNYGRKFDAWAINQRKSRALAIGECALQALDDVKGLLRTKALKPNSLWFMISESPVPDENGEKKFHCSVMYSVTSYEPAHTEEWIQEELEETFEKMMRETDELYPAEEGSGNGTGEECGAGGEVEEGES
jgi:hypothetical protein